ncbi:MAG TPA: DUF2127 domain-containing protein [Ktedonobacteraceae bacterium]
MINIQRTRPLGITIIAIIAAVFGILGIIGGLLLLQASTILGVITVVFGLLEFVIAWGLWNLRTWAFWATVIVETLALLNGIFTFTQGRATNAIIGIVIPLVILIYMFADRNVRAAFRT